MHAPRIRRLARATVLVASLAIAATPAHAALEPGPSTDGMVTVAKYVGCAGGLAFAKTPGTAFAALAVCFKMIADEWNATFH